MNRFFGICVLMMACGAPEGAVRVIGKNKQAVRVMPPHLQPSDHLGVQDNLSPHERPIVYIVRRGESLSSILGHQCYAGELSREDSRRLLARIVEMNPDHDLSLSLLPSTELKLPYSYCMDRRTY